MQFCQKDRERISGAATFRQERLDSGIADSTNAIWLTLDSRLQFAPPAL
jgi:hypothetical protein